MTRDDETARCRIKTAKTFLQSGVAKEHTCSGAGSEFVGCSCGDVRVAQATEDTKMGIGW